MPEKNYEVDINLQGNKLKQNYYELLAGTVDPSVSPGVAAPLSSFYFRNTSQVYKKVGAGNTAWIELVSDVIGTVSIIASATVDVDVFSLTLAKSVKWLIDIEESSKENSYIIFAREKSSGNVFKTRYARLGDDVSHLYAVTSDGTDLKLTMTNNETNTITVKFRRIIV